MPLKSIPKGASKQEKNRIIGQNIEMLIKEGRNPEQARAIAINKAREEEKRR